MAVRLTVVISQVSQGTSKQQALEASLIAELIGRAGIDVSLIGPLSQVEHSATDRLVLEGISGDFAVVTWLSADQAMEQLATLHISGRRTPHRADPQVDNGPASDVGRRIYCFDLNRFSTSDALAESLCQLLDERRVVTVSLAPPTRSGSPAPSRQPAVRPSVEGGGPVAPAPNRSAKAEPETAPPSLASDAKAERMTPDDERERAANARLDALVDDLNMLDL